MNLTLEPSAPKANAVAERQIKPLSSVSINERGRVYTEIVTDVTKATLLQIVKGKVSMDSTIHTDGFPSYDGIVHLGYQKHHRILHSDGQFAIGSNHINGIEGFWGFAKVRLTKFRGLSKNSFYFHLKECEFRFNYRNENLYSLLLRFTKDNGLI